MVPEQVELIGGKFLHYLAISVHELHHDYLVPIIEHQPSGVLGEPGKVLMFGMLVALAMLARLGDFFGRRLTRMRPRSSGGTEA